MKTKQDRDTSSATRTLKPHANGRNIAGQQLPALLDVTCCVRMQTMLNIVVCCCVLLGVVPQSLKPVKLLSQQLPVPIFLLFHDRRCWNNVGSMLDPSSHLFQHCCCWPRMRITQGYTPFRDHPTMHCRSQHCWELLHPFAHHC